MPLSWRGRAHSSFSDNPVCQDGTRLVNTNGPGEDMQAEGRARLGPYRLTAARPGQQQVGREHFSLARPRWHRGWPTRANGEGSRGQKGARGDSETKRLGAEPARRSIWCMLPGTVGQV